MSNELKFTHIFNDNIERIFNIFIDLKGGAHIAYADMESNLNCIKGKGLTLLEEDSIYSCKYKNYYDVTFKLEKNSLINTQMYKTYTHIFNLSSKMEVEYKVSVCLYYDTIDKKTICIFNIIYEDDFFTDLFKTEFTEESINKMFSNVEDLLIKNMDKAGCYYSSKFNKQFEIIADFLNHPKKFLSIFPDDFKYKIPNDNIVFDIFDMNFILKNNDDNKENNLKKKFIKITPVTLIGTLLYNKIALELSLSKEKASYKVTFELKKLNLDKCFLSMCLEYIEPMSYNIRQIIEKFWGKRFKTIQKLFPE